MSQQAEQETTTVAVRNVGGIDECEVSFTPGVTLFTGQNATNRTSLLSALTDALGGSVGTLKTDADEGSVELALGEETYIARYTRQNSRVAVEREPYTDETELIDLFACLLDDNPARRAVERNDDLREIIMRPVDTEAIQDRIRSLEREREQVSDRIDKVERERGQLGTLEERRTTLQDDLADVEEELADVRATVEEYRADADEAEAAEELLDELEELRGKRTDLREQLESQEAGLDALREERTEVENDLDELTVQDDELTDIETELARLQERERGLADTINDVAAVVDFNDEMLDDGHPDLASTDEEQDVTAELDPTSKTIECWTCGSQVTSEEITDKLEQLSDLVEEKRHERRDVRQQVDELRERRQELRAQKDRQERLERQLRNSDTEIERRQERVADLEDDIDDVQDQISESEERIEETEELRDSDLLEQYQRLSELEYQRGRVEQDLAETEDEIEQIEGLADEREQLEAQRTELRDELASLRTRIEDLEASAIEAFNDHMADVLSLLEYENIERVWIERVERDVREGRRKVTESQFDLHVVRATASGAVYEDTVDNLSESEREVIGLVTALAGYLVHDVHETVPMMLLDSLEAIDADRIAALVDYFAEYAPYLLVALLPEDASALNDEYARVSADTLAS
jgi:septal ring factor EnvC (AmiA/AmiB activator)